MKHLHAHWRMEYIEAPQAMRGNIFEMIPQAKNEREVFLIHRGKHNYIVMNRYPYNAGHLLVAPYRAVTEFSQLSVTERADLMETIVKAQDILTQALSPDGFNTGFNFGSAAGAGIPQHIHCHIVPRWQGDTNFMPVIGDTKVLPQSLDAMWQQLRRFA